MLQQKTNPIAPGLGSTATIKDGNFFNIRSNLPEKFITKLNFSITSGKITRNENGKLVSNIIVRSPFVDVQEIIKEKGADKIDFISEESFISTDSSKPTVFTVSSTISYPKIALILGFTSEQDVEFYSIKTILKGYLKKDDLQKLTFEGTFDAVWEINLPNGSYETSGKFNVVLI